MANVQEQKEATSIGAKRSADTDVPEVKKKSKKEQERVLRYLYLTAYGQWETMYKYPRYDPASYPALLVLLSGKYKNNMNGDQYVVVTDGPGKGQVFYADDKEQIYDCPGHEFDYKVVTQKMVADAIVGTIWADWTEVDVLNCVREEKVFEVVKFDENGVLLKNVVTNRARRESSLRNFVGLTKEVYYKLSREANYASYARNENCQNFGDSYHEVVSSLCPGGKRVRRSFPNGRKPQCYYNSNLPILRFDVVYFRGDIGFVIGRDGNKGEWIVDTAKTKGQSTIESFSATEFRKVTFVRRIGGLPNEFEDGKNCFSYLPRQGMQAAFVTKNIEVGDIVSVRHCRFKVKEILGYGENGLVLERLGFNENGRLTEDGGEYIKNIKDVEFIRRTPVYRGYVSYSFAYFEARSLEDLYVDITKKVIPMDLIELGVPDNWENKFIGHQERFYYWYVAINDEEYVFYPRSNFEIVGEIYVGEYYQPEWCGDGQHKNSKGEVVSHVEGEFVNVNDCDVEHPEHYDSKYYNKIKCRQNAVDTNGEELYFESVEAYEWYKEEERWVNIGEAEANFLSSCSEEEKKKWAWSRPKYGYLDIKKCLK
jgi:hypothetical protein